MPHWCLRRALERRTTWCWFTRALAWAERRSSPIFMGRGFAILLSLPAEPRSRERADRAAWILLACTWRGTLSRSVMCSARVPEGPSAVRAAWRRAVPSLPHRGLWEAPAVDRCWPARHGRRWEEIPPPRSSKDSMDETIHVVALPWAPTAAVRRARSACLACG